MRETTYLFGFIPISGKPVSEDDLTHFLVVHNRHNSRPWWAKITRKAIKGYEDPFAPEKPRP